MRIVTKALILSFFILLSPYTQALPKAFIANYSVQKSGITLGDMQAKLSYQGNNYHYHKKTTAKGLAAMLSGDVLVENSDGVVKENRLMTQHYLRHHKSKRKDKKDEFRFISSNTVQGHFEKQPYTLKVPNNTTDMTALELQLMQALATNKHSDEYNIVDRGQLKQYSFKQLGTETLNLAAGNFHCEKVQLVKKGSDTQTIIWMSKELNYIPVRIKHIDDGDVLEAQMTSYQ